MSTTTAPSRVHTTGTVLVSALLALTGSVCLPPTIAQAATTPCRAGTPVLGDYDGDGAAEALINQWATDHARYWQVAADGRATRALDSHDRTRNADLNGDVCADLVVTDADDTVRLILGSPSGLDVAGASSLTIPQLAGITDEDVDLAPAIGLRHDGISQVVVSLTISELVSDETGPSYVDVYTLAADGTPGTPQVITGAAAGTQLGTSLFTTLDGSGRSFAVGSPTDKVGKASGAGAVYLFSADAADPTRMVFRTRITQASKGVPDSAEKGDGFGAALSFRDGRLAIGVPGENIGKATDTGLVQPITWHQATRKYTAHRAIHQGTAGVVGTNEPGDEFGTVVLVTRGLTAAGSYDIAIGAPSEDVDKVRGAGSVTVANFTKKLFRTYTQNSPGVPGAAEQSDFLGWSLGVLPTAQRVDVLLASAVNESVGACRDAGVVVRSDGRRLGKGTAWTSIPSPSCSEGETAWGLWIAH